MARLMGSNPLFIFAHARNSRGYVRRFFMVVTDFHWIVRMLNPPQKRHSIILEEKGARARKQRSEEGTASQAVIETISDTHNKGKNRSVHSLLTTNLRRPIRFLMTEPRTIGAAL